jgi:glycosyltransferase involved in cell wall biosynthesis
MESSPLPLAFALISMEGPDQYSQAGGLGVRVTQLSRALAAADYPTRVYFLGDPQLPAAESWGEVELCRLAQEISREFPGGVYQGEMLKVSYLADRFPPQLVTDWVLPQLEAGRLPVLLFEEWQTAAWARGTFEMLWERGLADRCLLLWNANNQFGFERVDWVGLDQAAAITTISRHMRLLVEGFGVDPIVIPNGIPEEHLLPVDQAAVAALRRAAGGRQVLLKVGRFHRDKGWIQAVKALGELRAAGRPLRMLARGGNERYRQEVMGAAAQAGLRVERWEEEIHQVGDLVQALEATPEVDLLELVRFLPEELLPLLYASSLAVLANSGFEPFGLVGLETMASCGLAVVGATGEDYARHLHNSVVIETSDPSELAQAIATVAADPERAERIRLAGREMAGAYCWPQVIEGDFLPRLSLLARRRGIAWPLDRLDS